ncbi:alpha/beta fold hydrolase BchO [Novosphingobium sp.]|uniref:alpha/beta fold hydrolase BchO n=1 Tax=Novosphingobium sp. TaxID=1874826 RepID=UPI0033410BDB
MSSAPRWDVEGQGWPNRADSRFVEVGRVRWHVQTMGPENAPVLLLIHGTGAATHSWRDLAPLLATRFRVVACDLPGHGFTRGRPAAGLTMAAMARAVADLLGVLGMAPALIVGHSAGAAIGLRMVLDGLAAPRAVVGLGAALLPIPGLAGVLFPTLARMLFVNPLAPHLFARMARVPGETGRFLARSTASRIDATGVSAYERLFATAGHCAGAITMMADWDLPALRRDLGRVPVPVLLIHGAADAAIPLAHAHETATIIPTARVVSLAGLGHLVHEERAADVAALITEFATEVC